MSIYRQPPGTDSHPNLIPTLNAGVARGPSCIFSERFDHSSKPVVALSGNIPIAMQMPPGWSLWQAADILQVPFVDPGTQNANLLVSNNAATNNFAGSLHAWPVMKGEAANPPFITWNVFARAGVVFGPDYFDDGSNDEAYSGLIASPAALLPNADGEFVFAGNLNGTQGVIGQWSDRATLTKQYNSAFQRTSLYIWLFMQWDRDSGTTTVFPSISTDGKGWNQPPVSTSVYSITWKAKPAFFGLAGSIKVNGPDRRFVNPRLDYVHIFGSLTPQFVTFSSEGGPSYY